MMKKISGFILLILCISVNLYFRLFPAYFPQLKHKARQEVENRLFDKADKIVKEQYFTYHPFLKEKIANELVKEFKRDKKEFKKEIEEEYLKLKNNWQDEEGQTYLLELDPYLWMRWTEQILLYGHPGDKKINNKFYDTLMLAPKGMEINYARFPYYLAAYLYKIVSFFIDGISFHKFLFYLPIFYSLIFFLFLFLFCRYFFSEVIAFFSVLFIGLTPIFIGYSCAGWFDHNVLSLLFPLAIVWTLVLALREDIKRIILFSFLSSFLISLYAFTWVGWWFIFVVIMGFYVYSILNNIFIYKKERGQLSRVIKPYILSLVILFVSSFLFCLLIPRINFISTIYNDIKVNLHIGKSWLLTIWPNTYYTVGELTSPSLEHIATKLGGSFLFLLSLVGFLWSFLKERRTEKKDLLNLLVFWFIFMLFASLRGVRFVLFLSIPIGICFGRFIYEMVKVVIDKLRTRHLKLKLATLSGIAVILVLIINILFENAKLAAQAVFPLMNDKWYSLLIQLRESTPSDTVINSWWDYGNWFTTVGRRRVIFDGQSQHTPLSYWMARIILSKNEEEAIKILRMINNSSNEVFELLNYYIKEPFRCIKILEKMLTLSLEETKQILTKEKIPKEAKEKILNFLYKTPAPAYFIVEESMVGKISAISFLGNWDYKKLYVLRNRKLKKEKVIKKLIDAFNITLTEAESLYNEVMMASTEEEINEVLSKRYIFRSNLSKGKKEGDIVYFDNGLVYDFSSHKVKIYSQRAQDFKVPQSVFLFEEKTLNKREFKEADSEISCLIFKDKDEYKSIILDSQLAESLFVRLYFLKGEGLKYFEPFLTDEEANIYVYKIKWD